MSTKITGVYKKMNSFSSSDKVKKESSLPNGSLFPQDEAELITVDSVDAVGEYPVDCVGRLKLWD